MTPEEEQREKIIENVANMLRQVPFKIEFKIKKKPEGIKVICEVTREQMDIVIEELYEKKK